MQNTDPPIFISSPLPSLADWSRHIAGSSIPVLSRTLISLAALAENPDQVAARDIARVVIRDPLMTLSTLVWASGRMRKRLRDRLSGEVETVEACLLMVGLPPFFEHFRSLESCEARLENFPQAKFGLLRVLARSVRASQYAGAWAAYRHDLDAQVIQEAALLHDAAELLVWCFAPELALLMQAMQVASPNRRSVDIQRRVLGITVNELEVEMFRTWHLPSLLLQLTNDANAAHPAVRNVALAVNLARHSANGWNDPALADDYQHIAALLNTTPLWVEAQVRPAGR